MNDVLVVPTYETKRLNCFFMARIHRGNRVYEHYGLPFYRRSKDSSRKDYNALIEYARYYTKFVHNTELNRFIKMLLNKHPVTKRFIEFKVESFTPRIHEGVIAFYNNFWVVSEPLVTYLEANGEKIAYFETKYLCDFNCERMCRCGKRTSMKWCAYATPIKVDKLPHIIGLFKELFSKINESNEGRRA